MKPTDFYKNHSGAEEVRGSLMRCIKALSGYLLKVQKDGYIVPEGNVSFGEVLLKELFIGISVSFVTTCKAADTKQGLLDAAYDFVSDWNREIFLLDRDEFLAATEDWNERMKNGESTSELYQAYGVLCRFDQMSQEYSGAFYRRMGVENPGRMSAFYLQLLDAAEYILAKYSTGECGDVTGQESFRRSMQVLKDELKEMELEFLE